MKRLLMAGVVALAFVPGMASAQEQNRFIVSTYKAVTRDCTAFIKQAFPWFDAYYDPENESWHMTGNTVRSNFYFLKCLRDHGLSPVQGDN